MRLVVLAGLSVWALTGIVDARAQDATAPDAGTDWIVWHDPFGECSGNCAVAGYFGQHVETLGLDLLSIKHSTIPIADWEWGDSYLLGLTGSRRLATIGNVLEIEPELGVAKRFGDMTEFEFWGALWFRWTWFPWNAYVRTTFALSTGLNYATSISQEEVNLSGNGEGSHLLHYLGGEVTFSLPDHPDWELITRFHHRSGGYRFKPLRPISRVLFNSTYGGAHFFTVGMRKRF